jgi:hypothetical protein
MLADYCWTVRRQDRAESDPRLHFRYCTGDGQNKVNTRHYRNETCVLAAVEGH